MEKLKKIKNFILDFIFPIKCLGCQREFIKLETKERWICPKCFGKIEIRENQVCPVCEQFSEGGKIHYRCQKKSSLDGLWVATEYKYEIVRRAIHRFKFNFIQEISFPLSEILIKSILETKEYGDFQDLVLGNFSQESGEEKIYFDDEKNQKIETIIVPVPLHKRRYNWRGFNQSFLLSEYLAERFKFDVCDNLLLRKKNTKPQTKIKSMKERMKNIEGAFFVSDNKNIRKIIDNKNVIIVDDVCTTSATLGECAKELKKAGANEVWGLVVARR
ncbi:MAG: ComF family protein [Methanosarcinaceae archaeon]